MKALYPIRMKHLFVLSFLLMSLLPSASITSYAAKTSSPAPALLYDDAELDAAKQDLMNMIYECMKVLEDSHQALSEKATSDEAPELYQQVDEIATYLAYARNQLDQVTSIEELKDLQMMVMDIRKRLEELRYKIEEFEAAQTFTATTIEGVEMTFKVLSEDDKTCQVWRPESNNFAAPVAIDKATMGQVTIPETANGYRVVSICDEAFYYCPSITSVIVPAGVLEIGERAFCGCESLAQINLPGALKSIGSAAFYGTAVSSVLIPASVQSIGSVPYGECPNLIKIEVASGNTRFDARDNCNAIISTQTNSLIQGCHTTSIPSGVVSIGWMAFKGCTGMANLFIPKTVQSISYTAFELCSGLKSITVEDGNLVYDSRNNCNAIIYTSSNCLVAGCDNTIIPEDIVAIGEDAFMGRQNLTDIQLPKSVKSIGGHAFEYCKSLESVVIPEGVTSIAYMAFYGCSGLKSVSIPESATSIGFCTFDGCSSLTEVVIPDYVTSLDNQAFMGCSSLEKVTLGAGITKMNYASFLYCDNLKTIISRIQEPFALQSGVFDYNDGAILYVPYGTKALYEATEGWNKFANIVEMEKNDDIIVFADANVKALCVENWDTNGDGELSYDEAAAVTDLGGVFSGNNDITSFDELQYFTGITSLAFSGCSSLKSIKFPASLTDIPSFSFRHCASLENIELTEYIKSIGEFAFADCTGLTSVNIPKNVESIGIAAFGWCNLDYITVDESNAIYQSPDGCNAVIDVRNDMLVVGTNHTVIPESVKIIGDRAFAGCEELPSVTLPSGLTAIYDWAFSSCTSLQEVFIPANVMSIKTNPFSRCNNLNRIVVDPANTTYDSRENCNGIIETSSNTLITGIQATVIPNTVTTIGSYAYYDCRNLTSISIPSSVTRIAEYAFGFNYSLTTITIPNSVKIIENSAFYANSLRTIISEILVPFEISDYAFDHWNEVYNEATLYVPYGTKALYEATEGWNKFQNIVEMEPVDIEPLENGDVIDFGDFVDESGVEVLPALDGNVVGNLYFNILKDNGGYDAEEGCIVITESTADETIERIADKDFYDKELRETFTGIIFKVPAGSGNIKITAEALGSMLLKVRIGDDEPQSFELDGRQKVKIPYTVSQETLVYIYAGEDAAVKGVHPVTASSGMLRIFGIESESIPTAIADVETSDTPVTIYSVSGQRLAKPQKGINIIGGKKVVVK